MSILLATLVFFALVAALACLPFIPAVRELRERRDIEPVHVIRDSEVDVRHLARGYESFMREHLAGPLSRCREEGRTQEGSLPDGTGYFVLPGDGETEPPLSIRTNGSCNSVVLSCGALRVPPENVWLQELYAAESVHGGADNVYRAILAGASIDLAPRSTSLRWLHAGRTVRVGKESRLHGRVSADERIELAGDCLFERLNAPRIAFGPEATVRVTRAGGDPLGSDDLPRVVDVEAGRWLIRRRLEFPEGRRAETDLVVTGRARIGDGARITGSIKSHEDMHLGRGVEVEGSVVSGRDLYLGEGCRIHGPVLAERTVFIGKGCVIGSAEQPTTVSARRVEVASGAAAHGTVWAHREGRLIERAAEDG